MRAQIVSAAAMAVILCGLAQVARSQDAVPQKPDELERTARNLRTAVDLFTNLSARLSRGEIVLIPDESGVHVPVDANEWSRSLMAQVLLGEMTAAERARIEREVAALTSTFRRENEQRISTLQRRLRETEEQLARSSRPRPSARPDAPRAASSSQSAPGRGASGLPAGTWEIEDATGEKGTWRLRPDGTYATEWRTGQRVTEVLEVTVNGSTVTARALSSSNNGQCTYTGTLRGTTIEGTYRCANVRGGPWNWSARLAALPAVWQVRDVTGGTAEWRLRTGSTYDTRWTVSGQPVTEVLEMTVAGDQVTAQVLSSSNNSQCRYTGMLRDAKIEGTYVCANVRGGPWKWEATAAGAVPGGGAAASVSRPPEVTREPIDDIATFLGTTWDVKDSTGGRATWRIRGAGVIATEWTVSGRTVTETLAYTIDGPAFVGRVQQSSNNSQCTYTGRIVGRQATGTYTCANASGGPWTWEATIR